MKVVNIIQARMGSSRFPKKMMADLHGEPVINWVLKRCIEAKSIDTTILATSDLPNDDVLAEQAAKLGVPVFRGSETDVLSRYASVTDKESADLVVRVCGDRPLIDPVLINSAVDFMLKNTHVDLAYNHISGQGQNWPRGFGVEIVKAEHIMNVHQNLDDPYHREHVTSHLWESSQQYTIVPLSCPESLNVGIPDIKCDLDSTEDLELIEMISKDVGMVGSAEDFFSNWLKLHHNK